MGEDRQQWGEWMYGEGMVVGGWVAVKGSVQVGGNKEEMGTAKMGSHRDGWQWGTRALTLMVFVCSLRPLRVLMALSASLGSE